MPETRLKSWTGFFRRCFLESSMMILILFVAYMDYTTLFLIDWCRYDYKLHPLFYLGFALWMYLEDDLKLACRGAELWCLFLG
jgi:hypothetical protein